MATSTLFRASNMQSAHSKQHVKASCSPDEEWENWMEWDGAKDHRLDQQPLSPSDTTSEDIFKHSLDRFQGRRPSHGVKDSGAPTKKRKLTADTTNEFPPLEAHRKSPSLQNRSHSIVEKRYRTNLNEKIAELRKTVPSLRDESQSPHDVQAWTPAPKFNKATVLTKAIEYIHHLENRNAYLEDANDGLRSQARNRVKNSHKDDVSPEEEAPDSQNTVSNSPPAMNHASTTMTDEPRGMIPVPEDIKKLRNVQQQPHYADRPPFHVASEGTSSGSISIRGGKHIGRIMVGSLAGLMIMDGFVGSRKEDIRDRGLFALPVSSSLLLTAIQDYLATLSYGHILLPLTRGFLIFAILGLALFLYLFNSKPRFGKLPSMSRAGDSHSSASPIEMRQKAWLTAIQTVRVPRHSILPEMLALNLETLAYMTRQVLGWRTYSWLTGRSEEYEIARVRAWEIAIDAQLSGGDTEISRSRLVLTLWASGSLPNSAAGLMLKALHIRIMFWQISRSLWICGAMNFAARYLAHYQWAKAQDIINNPTISKDPGHSEPLPDHLVGLLQQPINEIMTDSAIRYAHHLAWNRALSDGDSDMYTEDTAMLGSLDALAVWSSNWKLQQALYDSIESSGTSESHHSQIELALRIAPPGSTSSIRALAAAATFYETDRGTSIRNLMHALPSSDDALISTSLSAIPSTSNAVCEDILLAMDCAKSLEILASSEHESSATSALCKALQLGEGALSNVRSMQSLAFAATYQLMKVLSEHPRMSSRSLDGILMNAIMQLSEPPAQVTERRLVLRENYKAALQRLVLRGFARRRASNVSIDTGYGSMSDNELKS